MSPGEWALGAGGSAAANIDASLDQISCVALRRVVRQQLAQGAAHYQEPYLLEELLRTRWWHGCWSIWGRKREHKQSNHHCVLRFTTENGLAMVFTGLMRRALLWVSHNQHLRDTLPRYRFVRKAVRRFMPGEEPGDALQAAEELRTKGFSTVLTLLGENVRTAAEAEHVTHEYCDLLDQITARGLDTHLSVKLTQLGHDLDVNNSSFA